MSKLGDVRNFPHGAEGLEIFDNPTLMGIIDFETSEFTCLCPKTGQPDFATIHIRYMPDKLCVESKSLKLYLWDFRNRGAFHEAVTQTILRDLSNLLKPRWMQVMGDFGIRGGIRERVICTCQPETLAVELYVQPYLLKP